MNVMYKKMVIERNISDVSFMILNMKKAAATINELTRRVSFPVYQEETTQDIMGLLGGKKDDILIYNRCGLLVDHFTMPYSYLGYSFVRQSLQKVINKTSKCQKHCPATSTITTTQSTAMRDTSQDVAINPTTFSSSESVTSQPRPEAATES